MLIHASRPLALSPSLRLHLPTQTTTTTRTMLSFARSKQTKAVMLLALPLAALGMMCDLRTLEYFETNTQRYICTCKEDFLWLGPSSSSSSRLRYTDPWSSDGHSDRCVRVRRGLVRSPIPGHDHDTRDIGRA